MDSAKVKFLGKISTAITLNTLIISREDYTTKLQRMMDIQDDHTIKKTNFEYTLLKRYDVLSVTIEGTTVRKLVKKGTELRFVCKEDLFDVIHRAHLDKGHSGIQIMHKHLSLIYANVTRSQIADYISLCETCQLKKPAIRKSIVVKPMISNHMNSRCQVDLIDMQSDADGLFRYIFNYQDHLTKYTVLRPLKTKTAEEVAYNLVDVFTTFGAPTLFHSDNGREFCNKVVDEILTLWPCCKLVHGAPRHSQTQGSVERFNREVEKMLACWRKDNGTSRWAEELRFIQWQMNSRHHSGIGRAPYKAMFGQQPRLDIHRTNLPEKVAERIYNEEQLRTALSTGPEDEEESGSELATESSEPPAKSSEPIKHVWPNAPSTSTASASPSKCVTCGKAATGAHKCRVCQHICHGIPPCSIPTTEEGFGAVVTCCHCQQAEDTEAERQGAKQKQQQQADKMLKRSARRLSPLEVGTTVMVPVPSIDCGRAEFHNIKGVAMEVNEEGLHKIGTEHGVINQMFATNGFTPCHEKFLAVENVPDKLISLREVARMTSMGTGQEFTRCGCKGKCKSGRCKCFSLNLKCNSKCHGARTCDNKHE